MAAYPSGPRRPHPVARAVGGALRVAIVLSIVLAGLYFVFTGGGRPDRHGIEALKSERPLVGASLGDWPTDSKPIIRQFEEKIDTRLDVVDVFLDWYTPFHNVSHTLSHIAARGAIAQLSWEPHGFSTPDIVEGSKRTYLRDGRDLTLDEYLAEFAQGVCRQYRETHQPILVRTMHEFNGDWFWWGIGFRDPDGNHPNTNESYRQAWIKIHDAFESRCPDGVRFVWAVNHFSVGSGTSYMGPYPGHEYVDFVGIDGYNWGTHETWGWQSFDTIFLDVYCAVSRDTHQPILIAEVGSTESGGDKAAWIRDAFSKIADGTYSRVRGVIWFNTGKYERESSTIIDWPVDSSDASLQAFREGAERLQSMKRVPQAPSAACPT